MTNHVETDTDVGIPTLVAGIVKDARDLLTQQMSLFQVEVKNDLEKGLNALVPLIAGGGVLLAAVILMGIGSAHLLVWLIPECPLWGGFLGVGALVAVAGGALILWGKAMFGSITPPPEKSLEALKENIQWIAKK